MSDDPPRNRRREFFVFVIAGGVAAAVNWSTRIGFSAGGMSYGLAIVCAYVIGMTTAYLLSRWFVFERSGRPAHSEVWRFAAVNVVALAQVWAVSVLLDRWLLPAAGWTWRPAEIAHAVGVASPILTSYFGHRHFTFERKPRR